MFYFLFLYVSKFLSQESAQVPFDFVADDWWIWLLSGLQSAFYTYSLAELPKMIGYSAVFILVLAGDTAGQLSKLKHTHGRNLGIGLLQQTNQTRPGFRPAELELLIVHAVLSQAQKKSKCGLEQMMPGLG